MPTSSITAETVTVDGVVRSQKDTASITTTATRPLAIQKDGSWFIYGWDLTRNICELYSPSGNIRTAYTYSPYGQISSTGDVEQTIQWSSEYNNTELGMVYYNYRHYNPTDGRWTGRDKVEVGENYKNKYIFASNRIFETVDHLGNYHL